MSSKVSREQSATYSSGEADALRAVVNEYHEKDGKKRLAGREKRENYARLSSLSERSVRN